MLIAGRGTALVRSEFTHVWPQTPPEERLLSRTPLGGPALPAKSNDPLSLILATIEAGKRVGAGIQAIKHIFAVA
jgi:hypothetical protein